MDLNEIGPKGGAKYIYIEWGLDGHFPNLIQIPKSSRARKKLDVLILRYLTY